MSEIFKIVLTSSLTILGGAFLFFISQLIQRFLIEPAREQAKVIGEIDFCLTYYAAWYANPGSCGKEDEMAKASNALRECAGRLLATSNAIYCYNFLAEIGLLRVRGRSDIREVVGSLIRISNSIFQGQGRENKGDAENIRRLLRLE